MLTLFGDLVDLFENRLYVDGRFVHRGLVMIPDWLGMRSIVVACPGVNFPIYFAGTIAEGRAKGSVDVAKRPAYLRRWLLWQVRREFSVRDRRNDVVPGVSIEVRPFLYGCVHLPTIKRRAAGFHESLAQ